MSTDQSTTPVESIEQTANARFNVFAVYRWLFIIGLMSMAANFAKCKNRAVYQDVFYFLLFSTIMVPTVHGTPLGNHSLRGTSEIKINHITLLISRLYISMLSSEVRVDSFARTYARRYGVIQERAQDMAGRHPPTDFPSLSDVIQLVIWMANSRAAHMTTKRGPPLQATVSSFVMSLPTLCSIAAPRIRKQSLTKCHCGGSAFLTEISLSAPVTFYAEKCA